jgi:hypothetical protein
LINVSTVDPKDQERLVELWQEGTDEVMRYLPGFISANVHCRLDGPKWHCSESASSLPFIPPGCTITAAGGQPGRRDA